MAVISFKERNLYGNIYSSISGLVYTRKNDKTIPSVEYVEKKEIKKEVISEENISSNTSRKRVSEYCGWVWDARVNSGPLKGYKFTGKGNTKDEAVNEAHNKVDQAVKLAESGQIEEGKSLGTPF